MREPAAFLPDEDAFLTLLDLDCFAEDLFADEGPFEDPFEDPFATDAEGAVPSLQRLRFDGRTFTKSRDIVPAFGNVIEGENSMHLSTRTNTRIRTRTRGPPVHLPLCNPVGLSVRRYPRLSSHAQRFASGRDSRKGTALGRKRTGSRTGFRS